MADIDLTWDERKKLLIMQRDALLKEASALQYKADGLTIAINILNGDK